MTDDADIPVEELLSGLPDEQVSGWSDEDVDDRDAQMLGVTIVNWRELTTVEAPAAWQALGGWVDWFLNRYDIPEQKIPSCWWQHGAVVEELSALHTAWLVSFDETDSGYGPIGFHERLAVAMQRIAGHYHGQCADAHQARNLTRRAQQPDADKAWLAWSRTSHA